MKLKHVSGIGFATIFGLSFLFSKTALIYVSPLGLIAYRFLLAWTIFILLILFKIVKIEFKKHMLKFLLLSALFQPVIYFLAESYGLQYIGSGEAGLMIAIIPIFVTILSALILKEKPTPVQYLFIILSVLGVFVIQFNELSHASNQWIGFVLLFIAVLAASFFNITTRHITKTISPITSTFFMISIGAITFNTLYIINLSSQHQLSTYITNLNHIQLLLPILYLGSIASIGGFFLVNVTLKHMPAHVSSIYTNISTVIALIAGVIFLHEQLYWYHILGAVMILIGVYGTVRFHSYQFRK